MEWVRWVSQGQIFLLIFARCFGLIVTAPLLSSQAVPRIARTGLALFAAAALLPSVVTQGYDVPQTTGIYVMYMIGEAVLGATMGLILEILYSTFLLAGQFFSMQMGFSASQVFDPLAQMEIPVMGQFLNLMAMFLFLTVGGFQKIFLVGLAGSFEKVTLASLLAQREALLPMVVHTMSGLFQQALVIALPIMGTLFMVSVSMGLLAKAAPQMNLLMLGFPINIIIAFLVMIFALPHLMEAFVIVIENSFSILNRLFVMGSGG